MAIKKVRYYERSYESQKPRLTDYQRNYVNENSPLVQSLARQLEYVGKKVGLDIEDLKSAGYEGLISASRTFDPNFDGAEKTKGTLNYYSVRGYMIIAINEEKRKGFTIGKALVQKEDGNSPLTATAKFLESNIRLTSFNMVRSSSEDEDLSMEDVVSIKSPEDRSRQRDGICKGMREIVAKYITDQNELKVITAFFAGSNIPQIAKEWFSGDESRTSHEKERGIKQSQVQSIFDRVVRKLQELPVSEFPERIVF
jgi:DNA-directed RNA polymerase specialized sigma subunit